MLARSRPLTIVLTVVALSSCGRDQVDSASLGDGETATDSTTGDDVPDGDGDGDDDGDPQKFDHIERPDQRPPGEDGCAKVDILFVIANSSAMADAQQRLVDGFPEFIAALQATLPDSADVRVGVTKTDVFGLDDDPVADPDNPCASVLGGLLSHATPDGAATGTGFDCEFSSGANYMTDGPTLVDEFACVAKVGTAGNPDERQAAATLAALDPTNACSAGFLRDDAMTVVVVVTDDDDDSSAPASDDPGVNAQAWVDGVLAVEDGINSNVAFVLISTGSPIWRDCGVADQSPNLSAWADGFGYMHAGSVCAPDYVEVLSESIGMIESACADFWPTR